jgi:hypothetical protein
MRELGNDTVMAKCEYHCAHRTDGNNLGMFVGVYCCWCGKKKRVAITVKELPLPGHGTYSAAKTIVYDWPRGWGIREVPTEKHNV